MLRVLNATKRYDKALNILNDMDYDWNANHTYKIQFHVQQGDAFKGLGELKEASHNFLKAVSLTEELRQKLREKKLDFRGRDYRRPYPCIQRTCSNTFRKSN